MFLHDGFETQRKGGVELQADLTLSFTAVFPYRVKARRPSTGKKITTHFTAVVCKQTHNVSKVCL